MRTAVKDLPIQGDVHRKRWTRAEYESLSGNELLSQQRLELVEGELINQMGKGRPHTISLKRLERWLERVFGEYLVESEASIDVSAEDNPTSEPEPDIVVLDRDASLFPSANPGPQNIRLVIEVADSSLYTDLTIKAALYARAGIVEYWVLDIVARRMIVHRDPHDGRYTSIISFGANERVAALAAPGCALRVGDVFPQ
jgi:Uma2 family endonuclease